MSDEAVPIDPYADLSTDPAHLFMQLYDLLPDELFFGRLPTAWRDDDEVSGYADAVTELVLAHGAVEFPQLAKLVRWEGDQGLFCILLGLDQALLMANPFAGAYDQGALTAIARRYAETGLFNDPAVVPGALLPRCAISGGPVGRGHKADFFAVHRVTPEVWDKGLVVFKHLQARYTPAFLPGTPVKVACVPMISSYEDLEFTTSDTGYTPTYRLTPKKDAGARDRIARIIDSMDAAGARIAVMPEGTLLEELLELWIDTAINTAGRNKPLRWLLLGSGPLGGMEPPANRTVLVDRWTGETLLVHDKLERFTITDAQVSAWRLPLRSGRPVEEDMTRGRTVQVLETGLGRLAALICEDLNSSTGWEREFGTYGVSHLFVPIFSRPILRYRWEHIAADRQVRHLGAWVVISNSLAVETALRADPGEAELSDSEIWYSSLVLGPLETERRTRYGAREQFCRAYSADDLGRLADGNLPEILPGVVYSEWFGGRWSA